MTVRPDPDLQTHTHITLSQLFFSSHVKREHALGRTGGVKETFRERDGGGAGGETTRLGIK